MEERFPGRMGLLMSPGGCRNPRSLPYAIDNGMYAAFVRSGHSIDINTQRNQWDHDLWRKGLEWALKLERSPLWAVAPDVVGNAEATRDQFRLWHQAFQRRGLITAIAVQDGMTPADVPDGVVCFLGGTTEWKWRNLAMFCRECPRVHVGRVNSYRRLWQCHEAGAESCDGSGWFRGDQSQLRGLFSYLEQSTNSQLQPSRQLSLLKGKA